MGPIYFDEIEDDDILIITPHKGIAINVLKNRVLIFQQLGLATKWEMVECTLEEFRSFKVQTPNADELFTIGNQGLGTALGIAARNTIERRDAEKATGITIEFKSVSFPELFLNIVDKQNLASANEALRQLFEDGRLREAYRTGHGSIEYAWRRPTAEQKRISEKKIQRKETWAMSWKPTMKDIVIILSISAFLACITWVVYRQLVLGNVGRKITFFSEDVFIFYICALPFAYILRTWVKVRKKLA